MKKVPKKLRKPVKKKPAQPKVIRKPMPPQVPEVKRDEDHVSYAPTRGRVDRCKCYHVWAVHHIRMDGHCSEDGCECKGFTEA